jgi:hypothetical protein
MADVRAGAGAVTGTVLVVAHDGVFTGAPGVQLLTELPG